MIKLILSVLILFVFINVWAQITRLQELSEQLAHDPQLDIFRVNRLTKIAARRELSTADGDTMERLKLKASLKLYN